MGITGDLEAALFIEKKPVASPLILNRIAN